MVKPDNFLPNRFSVGLSHFSDGVNFSDVVNDSTKFEVSLLSFCSIDILGDVILLGDVTGDVTGVILGELVSMVDLSFSLSFFSDFDGFLGDFFLFFFF